MLISVKYLSYLDSSLIVLVHFVAISGQLHTYIQCQWSPWHLCRCSSSGGLHLCIIHSGNEQCTSSVPCSSSRDYHPTWCDWSNICGNHTCRWILHCCWKLLPRTDHCQEWRRCCNVSLKHHACIHWLPYLLLNLINIRLNTQRINIGRRRKWNKTREEMQMQNSYILVCIHACLITLIVGEEPWWA